MTKPRRILACYDDVLQELATQVNALVGACEAKDLAVMADSKARVDRLYELARAHSRRAKKQLVN